MQFEKLYDEVLCYYPRQIDISDGIIVSETNGFDSTNLFDCYETADQAVSIAGEWQSLINWIIYQVLHVTAMDQFTENKYLNTDSLNKGRFRDLLIENLKTGGYEDMYLEFVEYEKAHCIFK